MATSISGSVFSESSHTFSAARCLAYARLYLNTNRKTLLLSLCQIFIISFIFLLFNFYVTGTSIYEYLTPSANEDPLWRGETSMMEFIFIIVMMLSGSMMFGSVSGRRDRLYSLQIPASQFEKFLTWLVIYLPLTVIASWICFYAADICRVLWVKVFTSYASYAHIIPVKDIICFTTEGAYNPETTFSIITSYSFCLLLNALFALGGMLFHKLAFIKTMISVFILATICILMIFFGITVFYNGSMSQNIDFSTREYSSSLILIGISILISAYIYWLSYARLKEEEIISRW